MRWKLLVVPVLALFFVGTGLSAHAQVTYSADTGKKPFTVGVGISNFSDDWRATNARQAGITLWADWRLPYMPAPLQGLGIEFEGRDINWATSAAIPGHRMDTALGGPMYQWRRRGRIKPFGKYLIGIGSIDFPSSGTTYTHDTRTVYEPGVGVDVRFWNNFSARATYDYQFWHQLLGLHDLNPNGFTIGAAYDFGLRPSR
jgi:opacity protein-like surface antigen